jgi:hypothetical protein
VGVAVGVPGVDGGGVDLDLQRRLFGHLGDVSLAADVGEAAADLGHQVPGDELERRVRGVDLPGPDLGTQRPLMTRVPGIMVTASVMCLSP